MSDEGYCTSCESLLGAEQVVRMVIMDARWEVVLQVTIETGLGV